jgi:hypothetical protein
LAFISSTLTEHGGGAKIASHLAHGLSQFSPQFFAARLSPFFAPAFGIPKAAVHSIAFDDANGHVFWDPGHFTRAVTGVTATVNIIGLINNVREWADTTILARAAGVRVNALACILGLGDPRYAANDIDVIYGMAHEALRDVPLDAIGERVFTFCPPVAPAPVQVGREKFRRRVGIPADAFVVGCPIRDESFLPFQEAREFSRRTGAWLLSPILRDARWPPTFASCGTLKPSEMGDFYAASDVIVHLRTEVCSTNLMEAFLAGKPAIALWTDSNNGHGEFMWPKGGYLARDAFGLLDALLHCFRHRDDAAERAANAYGRAIAECAPPLACARFESLLVRAAVAKGLLPSSALFVHDDIERWRRGQRAAQQAWRKRRAEIVNALADRGFV